MIEEGKKMDICKPEMVKVTLHLTEEAANILHQYAGERGRGYFVSQLLVQLRQRDDEVAQAYERKQKRSVKPRNGRRGRHGTK